jgi:hypothetical protein
MNVTTDIAFPARALSPSESVSSPARNTIRMAVDCRGPLAPDLLRRAWQLVGGEVPGLAGTLRHADGGYVFHPSQDRAGLVRWTDRNPTGDRLTAHLTLDELDCVAALEICRIDAESHVVSLLMRHSLADGRYGLYVLGRLWMLYTELVAGREPVLRAPVLARPLEAVLEGRHIPSGERRPLKPAAPAVYRSAPEWDGNRLSGLGHGCVRLGREDTERLVRRCKERSQSLHGVVSAAVLRSMSRSRPDLPAFALTSVVDIRPHVDPPVRATEGTYVLGYSVTTLDLMPDTDIDGIAKAVIENIRADLRSGAAQESSLVNAELRSTAAVPAMLSNLGVVPEFSRPEGLDMTDFRFWNEMDLESPGSPDVLAVYGHMITTSTFAGRLRVDLFHGHEMFPADWTAEQVRQIEETLIAYAA